MKIIDISGVLENGMWSYEPPIPKVHIKRVASIDKIGWEAHQISFATISGTYLEASAHLIKGGVTIDQLKPEDMIKEAVVIKVPDKKPLEHITVRDLESNKARISKGDALLISTGWERMWNEEDFVKKSPHFTEESMGWVIERKISILGLDIPSSEDPQNGDGLNKALFRSGALLLAPLVNLAQISKNKVKLIALPLKVKEVCGCPCRALVLES
tara:strand:- start:99 stop:740 length:642 start_codon:yes stop_codon:yes gene_type:complete